MAPNKSRMNVSQRAKVSKVVVPEEEEESSDSDSPVGILQLLDRRMPNLNSDGNIGTDGDNEMDSEEDSEEDGISTEGQEEDREEIHVPQNLKRKKPRHANTTKGPLVWSL